MEIVGEASARVPDEFRNRHPSVPWRDMADFRSRLIHSYDMVDFDRLWSIVQRELPPLVAQLEVIVTGESGAGP